MTPMCAGLAFSAAHRYTFQPMCLDLDIVLDCLKRMEKSVLGLKQIRHLLPRGSRRERFDLIAEAQQNIEGIKRKVIQ